MKRIAAFLSLLLALAGCTKEPGFDGKEDPGSGYNQETFVQGLFRIKVRDGAGELDTRAFTRGGTSGMAVFDAAATRAGATAVRRVFSDGDRFRERRRQAGLHLWYDVSFGSGMTVEHAMAQFHGIEEIEIVEPVYRMVPAGDAGNVFSYSRAAYTPSFNDPLLGNQWIYHNDGSLAGSVAGADINLFPAWTVSTGHPDVIVAIVDGGFQWDHPDLAANVWYNEQGTCGYNFTTDSYVITPGDHGTHVAGTVAAVNNNGVGVCGIAGGDGTAGSGVRLMSCQIFDDDAGRSATIEEVMAYSADNGAVISQNSWSYVGISDLSESGKRAIQYFIDNAGRDEHGNQTGPMAGGIVIFSAGNNNTATPTFPAAYEKVIGVGSIGPDFVKSPESNYGEWINLVATGGNGDMGSEYRTYSTTTDGGYGYAAGTSMACPQVSGIAALAVSKYGGPGFTNEMLWELLIGSGRRELVESYNPQYKDKLGAGLVDAEYIFYKDTAPQPVTSLSTESRRYHVRLEWKVPADYLGRPVAGFEVFASTQPLSGGYGKIPESAVKYEIANTFGDIGATAEYTVHDLDPTTKYWFAVVSESKYGTPSTPLFISAETSENSQPFVVTPLPDIYLEQVGTAGRTSIDIGEYFSDPDAPTDKLSFFVSYSAGGIVECRLEDGMLVITPVGTGSVTLTVTAQDIDGEFCSNSFTVVAGSSTGAIDLYPNPVKETLYIRIPEASGNYPVRIYNRAGQLAADTYVEIAAGSPGSLDVSGLSPGNYTFVLDYHERELKKNIIKR